MNSSSHPADIVSAGWRINPVKQRLGCQNVTIEIARVDPTSEQREHFARKLAGEYPRICGDIWIGLSQGKALSSAIISAQRDDKRSLTRKEAKCLKRQKMRCSLVSMEAIGREIARPTEEPIDLDGLQSPLKEVAYMLFANYYTRKEVAEKYVKSQSWVSAKVAEIVEYLRRDLT